MLNLRPISAIHDLPLSLDMAPSLHSSSFLPSTPIKTLKLKPTSHDPLLRHRHRHRHFPRPISSVHVESSTAPPAPPAGALPHPVPELASPRVARDEIYKSSSRREVMVRSVTRSRTKFVCTVGPATCSRAQLEALAEGGMSVARLNMCHGTRQWHRTVIEHVRRINQEKGYGIAVMMDTEGSEIHMGDLDGATPTAKESDVWTFSVRSFVSTLPERTININYGGFAEEVKVGDEVLVDGGMVRFEVIEKIGPDVICRCIDSGLLLPRANLTIRRDGRLVQVHNAMLPTISSKDWVDIDFGILEGVDYIAVSFVKTAEVIYQLKSYIAGRTRDNDISVIAKIENIDSLKNLKEIIKASDGVMVARLDLGTQIPLEQVPLAQEKIVEMCRALSKPVIVASQLLESMIEYPIPTRAEVADISEAVRQKADALMLSGESAIGRFPIKALSVLNDVSSRMEEWSRKDMHYTSSEDVSSLLPFSVSKELCVAAAGMADKLGADALFVYTKTGQMASLLSGCRPKCSIVAFTPSASVQRRMKLQWGLLPFQLSYSDDMKSNLDKSFDLLRARGRVNSGDVIITVSDISQTIQVVNVP